ncbi:MAG: LacI family DNA-binding transcriptional regulator [Eubacteriales bacterium]
MSKQNITIVDIARIAEVSPTAVSFVINNKPGVSDKTRAKVKRIIKNVGYTPNLNSQKLILNKSFNIFIVIDNSYAAFDNMFYNSAVIGIMEQCRLYNYNAVMADISSKNRSSMLKRAISQKNIDGAVFLQSITSETANELVMYELPFVVLDSHKSPGAIPSVYCDYTEASKKAVNYLIATGHKRIAFIGMSDIANFYNSMLKGYTEALIQAKIPTDSTIILEASQEKQSVHVAVTKLLSCINNIDSVFCSTDLIAIYAMQSLQHFGIDVPRDISICAVDNIIMSQLYTPSLTTVDIEKKKMGVLAVDMLMDMINNNKSISEVKSKLLPPGDIIVRESVKKRI